MPAGVLRAGTDLVPSPWVTPVGERCRRRGDGRPRSGRPTPGGGLGVTPAGKLPGCDRRAPRGRPLFGQVCPRRQWIAAHVGHTLRGPPTFFKSPDDFRLSHL